jgi:hypothetical protein
MRADCGSDQETFVVSIIERQIGSTTACVQDWHPQFLFQDLLSVHYSLQPSPSIIAEIRRMASRITACIGLRPRM